MGKRRLVLAAISLRLLEKRIRLNKSFVDSATKNYYASLFSVDFSKKETGDLISKWISENTNGMLKGSNQPVDQQILSIINTIYFYDEWAESFNKEDTRKDSFYDADGK